MLDVKTAATQKLMIAAHRGATGGNIPCNTLSSYKAALSQGADIVEIDVAVSADKQLFVFHPGMEYPHLRSLLPIRMMKGDVVKKLRYVNCDGTRTQFHVSTLDEVFELLKGKCYINIDKFWTAVPEITTAVRRHGLENQVIVKTSPNEKLYKLIEQVAPDLPYMVIIKKRDDISENLIKRKLNYIGAEVIFTSDSDPIVSDGYIEKMHANGLLVWGNSIVYDHKAIIAADHTDDTAIDGDREKGWLWFAQKKFDIVQTDWPLDMRLYYKEKGIY